jgi:hypothetical protein
MTDPDRIVLYAALVATTAATLLAGAQLVGLRLKDIGRAGGLVLEAVGLGVMFFIANIVAGIGFVALLRLAGVFVSVYAMDDVVLVLLSAGQGFVFHAWRMR